MHRARFSLHGLAALLVSASAAPAAAADPVWLSGGATQQDVTAHLAGYASRNITVGAVDIDSSWSTGYNNFVVDKNQWPDLPGFTAALHAAGQRVILWMTSMIDTDSSNYADAYAKGYLVRDGNGKQANISWWHGHGGLLDYSQPAAVSWWNAQMDPLLRMGGAAGGIDGWKCDGTDPFIIELITPKGGDGNYITYDQYRDWYYGGTFNHTRTINPEALIWSRPVDSYPLFLNLSAFLEFSPKYVMFSGWVGDQDPNMHGLRYAMINMFESAWQNYTNFGSDTGGYRGGTRTAETLIRWAQISAFQPLFENGGDGDHAPWLYDAGSSTEITDAYRRLVAAHYELGPYLFTTGTAAYAAGVSSIHPTAAPPADFPFPVEPETLGDYSFATGPTVFSSPIVYDGVAVGAVQLPTAANTAELLRRFGAAPGATAASAAAAAGWADYWNASAVYAPGARFNYSAPLPGTGARALPNPVFLRAAALVPLHVSTPMGTMPQGHRGWAAALTLLLPGGLPVGATAALPAADADGPLRLTATATRTAEGALRFAASPFGRPLILVWRQAAGHAGLGAAMPGAATVTATVTAGGAAGGRAAMRRRAPEPRRDGETPAALAYDATAPGGGRYPIGDLAGDTAAAYAADLAGTFSYAAGGGGAGLGEAVLYVCAEDAAAGVTVELVAA